MATLHMVNRQESCNIKGYVLCLDRRAGLLHVKKGAICLFQIVVASVVGGLHTH